MCASKNESLNVPQYGDDWAADLLSQFDCAPQAPDNDASARAANDDIPKAKTKKQSEADAKCARILADAREVVKATGNAAIGDALHKLDNLTPNSGPLALDAVITALAGVSDRSSLRDALAGVAAYKAGEKAEETKRRVKAEATRREREQKANCITILPNYDNKVLKYNERHAVIMVERACRILCLPSSTDKDKDGVIKPAKLWDTGAFHTLYENDLIDGRPATQLWMRHKDRNTFAGGWVFDPSASPGDMGNGTFNLWNGWSVSPKRGDWSLMRRHIFEIICRKNPYWFAWCMTWMADLIQNPAEKPGTAIGIKGDKGCGKSVVADYLRKMMKYNSLSISKKGQAFGRFNKHTETSLLTVVEEAFWAGDKETEGVLKDSVTGETMVIEPKGVDPYTVVNYQRFIFPSNNAWLLPATGDERRWIVLLASDAKSLKNRRAEKKKTGKTDPYFADLHKQMKNGGLEAMLFDLQNLILPSFVDLRSPPLTPWLKEQVEHSLEIYDEWWLSCLRNGAIDGSPDGSTTWDGDKPLNIGIGHVAGALESYARGSKRSVSKKKLGNFLKDKDGAVHADKLRDTSGNRLWYYSFPPLSVLRERFTTKHGIPFDDEGDASPAGALPTQEVSPEPDYSSWGIAEEGLEAQRSELDTWKRYGEGDDGSSLIVVGRSRTAHDNTKSSKGDAHAPARPVRPGGHPKRHGKRI